MSDEKGFEIVYTSEDRFEPAEEDALAVAGCARSCRSMFANVGGSTTVVILTCGFNPANRGRAASTR